MMNKEELGRRIFAASNIKGHFILRSGQEASEYFDKYLFEADPVLLRGIAQHMVKLLPAKLDKLAGLEMGGIPVSTALSLESGYRTLFVRKKAKEYGTKKIAEGGEVSGQELVVVEDVVTSGGAVVEAVNELRAAGATVSHVLCVIDRESEGRKNLQAIGLALTPLFTKSELESYAP